MASSFLSTARNKAIQYLAMREHSYLELVDKLKSKGFGNTEIDAALGELVEEKLLSDARFGEAFVRSKAFKGQGPVRIRMALRERGLDDAQIDSAFAANSDIDWDALVVQVFFKKFLPNAGPDLEGNSASLVSVWSDDMASKSKQWRFLQYRGFTQSQISRLFHRLAGQR